MRPSQLKKEIIARFKAGITRPYYIQGAPGGGKTEIGKQVAKEVAVECKVLHAPLQQPEDYGMPVVSVDKTDLDFIVSSTKFPIEGSKCGERGVLLIDELPQADVAGQKILANLILEREIHGKKLKKGWIIIATGNRTTDRAGAGQLLTHLKDRVTFVDLDISLDDWTNWALDNEIKTEVIAFLRFKPDLLSNFDPQQQKSPTPRGWCQGVSASLGVTDPLLEMETFKGEVGEGAAAEFCGFLKIFRELPSPDSILLNPAKADLPKEKHVRYALTMALAQRATKDNFDRVMGYVERMGNEFTTLFVRDAERRNKEVAETKAFIKWATKGLTS